MTKAERLLRELGDEAGHSMLSKAIDIADPVMTKHILIHGADIHTTVRDYASSLEKEAGWDVLFKAIGARNVDIARHLLEHGVDIKATTTHRRGILQEATLKGDSEMVELLLEKGADVHHLDIFGRSALYEAIITQDCTIVQYLLEAGGDANATYWSSYAESALHIAARLRNQDMIRVISSFLDDLNPKDGVGKTPLDYAKKYGNHEIIVCLEGLIAERSSGRKSLSNAQPPL